MFFFSAIYRSNFYLGINLCCSALGCCVLRKEDCSSGDWGACSHICFRGHYDANDDTEQTDGTGKDLDDEDSHKQPRILRIS